MAVAITTVFPELSPVDGTESNFDAAFAVAAATKYADHVEAVEFFRDADDNDTVAICYLDQATHAGDVRALMFALDGGEIVELDEAGATVGWATSAD